MNKDQIDCQLYIGKIFIHINKQSYDILMYYIISYDNDYCEMIVLKSYNYLNKELFQIKVYQKTILNIWINQAFYDYALSEWKTIII